MGTAQFKPKTSGSLKVLQGHLQLLRQVGAGLRVVLLDGPGGLDLHGGPHLAPPQGWKQGVDFDVGGQGLGADVLLQVSVHKHDALAPGGALGRAPDLQPLSLSGQTAPEYQLLPGYRGNRVDQ